MSYTLVIRAGVDEYVRVDVVDVILYTVE